MLTLHYGLWVIMMYQCRFISCIQYTTVVKDVDNGEGYACVEAGDKWEIFVSSSQLCCEAKTVVKKKKSFQKKLSSWNQGLFFFSLSSVFKKILLRVVYQEILLNIQLVSNCGCFQFVFPANLHKGQLTAYFSFIYFSTAQITND